MPVRLKKFLGTIALILMITLYAIFATAIATVYLADASGFVHLAYFLLSGLLWIIPAMLVIRWMEGYTPKERRPR